MALLDRRACRMTAESGWTAGASRRSWLETALIPASGWKLPLVVAEGVAGKPNLFLPGRTVYFCPFQPPRLGEEAVASGFGQRCWNATFSPPCWPARPSSRLPMTFRVGMGLLGIHPVLRSAGEEVAVALMAVLCLGLLFLGMAAVALVAVRLRTGRRDRRRVRPTSLTAEPAWPRIRPENTPPVSAAGHDRTAGERCDATAAVYPGQVPGQSAALLQHHPAAPGVKIRSLDEMEGWAQFLGLKPADPMAFVGHRMVSMAAWVAPRGERKGDRNREQPAMSTDARTRQQPE